VLVLIVSTVFWCTLLVMLESEQVSNLARLSRKRWNRIRGYRDHSTYLEETHFQTALDSIRTHVRRAHSVVLDDDVLAEQNMVHSLLSANQSSDSFSVSESQQHFRYKQNDFALLVHELSKRFDEKVAVDSLSFSVHLQECFGLLGKSIVIVARLFICAPSSSRSLLSPFSGINGAGKTTTFRMLVGELPPTSGDAQVNGVSLMQATVAFRSRIGYCPQFDALLDNLTGNETLQLFARLRGVPECYIPSHVARLVRLCDLSRHANRVSESYSGGTKRKLSVGIALTGRPRVLLLDEPTCGVDPKARRRIWQTLVSVRQSQQCSLLLTSHSMDECEALCARIGIMTAGQLRCLGSIQHLRNKFGHGYSLCIKLRACYLHDETYLLRLQTAVCEALPSAVMKDVHQTVLDYHIGDTTIGWASLFSVLDTIKQKFNLENYFIGDTTLEEIFVGFARQQEAQKN
jgi:ATP-binding cassette subfamily A (ABC1) protein 3